MKRRKKKQAAEKVVPNALLKAPEVVAKVKEMIEPVCASEGMELVQVEYQRESGGRVLRLYIDKPGGVRIEDCAYISRQVGDYLDVGLPLEETYRLGLEKGHMPIPENFIQNYRPRWDGGDGTSRKASKSLPQVPWQD